MPDRKFGRISPPTPPHDDPRSLQLVEALKPVWKPAPSAINWTANATLPGIMGENNRIGTCGPVSLANLIKLQSANTLGKPVIISDGAIDQCYRDVSGYDGRPKTDVGVVMQKLFSYAKNIGIGGHKILYAIALDPKLLNNIMWGIDVFCGAIFGWDLTQSALDQTDEGLPWSYVPGSPVKGGHATAAYRYGLKGLGIETWSAPQDVEWNYVPKASEETWCIITDFLVSKITHKSPAGQTLLDIVHNASLI